MRYIKSLMVVLEKGLYQIIEQLDSHHADQVKLETQHRFTVGMLLRLAGRSRGPMPSDKMLCAHASALAVGLFRVDHAGIIFHDEVVVSFVERTVESVFHGGIHVLVQRVGHD